MEEEMKSLLKNYLVDLKKKEIDKFARAKLLEITMREFKLSQRALGEKIGVPHSTIADWLLINKLDEQEYKDMKTQGLNDTEIYRELIIKKMEDRIEINGHWYVREDSLPQSENHIDEDMELIFSRTCTLEDDKRLFTFDVLENDNQELVMPSLSYCNKRVKDSDTIHVGDNENWFLQLIERDKLAISQLDGEIDLESDREMLIRFLTELYERNWF